MSLRRCFGLLHDSKWRLPGLRRMILPDPVILNRLATALLVRLTDLPRRMGNSSVLLERAQTIGSAKWGCKGYFGEFRGPLEPFFDLHGGSMGGRESIPGERRMPNAERDLNGNSRN